MTDLSRALAEEAKTSAARRSLNAWADITKAICPPAIRLREIREQIKAVSDRQREAEAPYIAEDVEIEQEIQRLKARQCALYEERCRVAAPFETELDALYEQELEIDGR